MFAHPVVSEELTQTVTPIEMRSIVEIAFYNITAIKFKGIAGKVTHRLQSSSCFCNRFRNKKYLLVLQLINLKYRLTKLGIGKSISKKQLSNSIEELKATVLPTQNLLLATLMAQNTSMDKK